MAVLTPTSTIHLPNSNHFCAKSNVKTFLSIGPSRQFLDYIPILITKVQATISSRASVIDSSAAVTERDGGDGGFSSLNSSRWMVEMEKPENAESLSRAEVVDFYVRILAKVLPSEREAQMCIYKASSEKQFFFCCEIEENFASELARISGVLSVSRDSEINEVKKDHESTKFFSQQSNTNAPASKFSPSAGKCVHWLVKMDKPGVEIVTKAQMVDYFANALTKVLGNEKDAQVCIYNISWEKDIGFCCQIDDENALKLSDVPGVLFVQPDLNPDSDNKNYKVDETNESSDATPLPEIKTKRLFVTGLSFYTSEKTLRAAFEPFGELVEVKIIMDKISKRSKGYAFIEYTTEESAGAALKEMNGKLPSSSQRSKRHCVGNEDDVYELQKTVEEMRLELENERAERIRIEAEREQERANCQRLEEEQARLAQQQKADRENFQAQMTKVMAMLQRQDEYDSEDPSPSSSS